MESIYQLFKDVLLKKIEIVELQNLKNKSIINKKYDDAVVLRDKEKLLQEQIQIFKNQIDKLKNETEIIGKNISKLKLLDNIESELYFFGFHDETKIKIQEKIKALEDITPLNDDIKKEINYLKSVMKFK